jgi:hypothetical protein
MIHDEMANYYDFLNLRGFKRQHEYHALAEFVESRGINRYYTNHYNRLIPHENGLATSSVIPDTWYDYTRFDVPASTKRSAVKDGIKAWCDWETETKKLYEQCYSDLCDLGEIAAACKVKELVMDVDKELKGANRLQIELANVDYSMGYIYMMQEELHDYYSYKEKEIGVEIC